jgi:hypothetical protein
VPEHVCVCVQAWKLWNEDRAAEFMDESLAGSYSRDEAWRCYHVGLLCVQENPRAPADLLMLISGDRMQMPAPAAVRAAEDGGFRLRVLAGDED